MDVIKGLRAPVSLGLLLRRPNSKPCSWGLQLEQKARPAITDRHVLPCSARSEVAREHVAAASAATLPGVVIREAEVQDVESMAVIEELTAGYWSAPEFAKEVELERSVLLVAEDEASTRGVEGLVLVWCIADEAQILEVAVHPEAQRRGIGTRLMSEALALSTRKVKRKAGRGAAILEVREGNDSAIRLYTKLGFKTVGHRRDYYPDGGSAFLMRLNIP